jgi:hypothetical protein
VTRLVSVALCLAAPACTTGFDNVGACRAWLDEARCGAFDFAELVDCSDYEEVDCDISGWFDCLAENTVCEAGTPDTSGWRQCASLATCD